MSGVCVPPVPARPEGGRNVNRRQLLIASALTAGLAIMLAARLHAAPRVVAQAGNQPAVRAQGTNPQAPSIAGAWKLNHEQSARVGGKAPGEGESGEGGRRRGGGPGGGGRGGWGGGMGGPGGMGGGRGGYGEGGQGRPDPEQMKAMRELMQEVMTPPETLTITQQAEQVTFTDADGHVRHYATNGKKEKHQLTNGMVETKTRWKDGQLEMETRPQSGMTIVQDYAVDPQTHQLVVMTKMQNSRFQGQGSREPIRRVYDPIISEQ